MQPAGTLASTSTLGEKETVNEPPDVIVPARLPDEAEVEVTGPIPDRLAETARTVSQDISVLGGDPSLAPAHSTEGAHVAQDRVHAVRTPGGR